MYKIYQVAQGDTLLSIAKTLNITPDILATLNGLNINENLIPGTYIVIPKDENNFVTYTIKKGDTIYEIAKTLNLKEDQLLKLNGLKKDDYIYPGDTINIPKEGIEFYITEENDTLNGLTQKFKTSADTIATQNDTIILVKDQLIIYKK